MRAVFGWRMVRVKGESMQPALAPHDYVVVRRGTAAEGDIVLVTHERFGMIIKRVRGRSEDGGYILQGDNPESTSPQALGSVPSEAILGVGRYRISPQGFFRLPGIRRRGDDALAARGST